ncbi:MAG: twin-arginine translocase subunit TatC [Planctomycetes bacterium]|nr:twin-arginine translocase subunit TatC [Planctomycetota bacterium]
MRHSAMSFGDHLEELRGAILRSLAAFAAIFALCLFVFSDDILRLLTLPYAWTYHGVPHLAFLRENTVLPRDGWLVRWFPSLAWLGERSLVEGPNIVVDGIGGGATEAARRSVQLFVIGIGERFIAVMQVAFVAALVLTAPIALWQGWRFVSAGLYPHERRVVWRYVPISVGLFVAGAALGYFFLVPIGLQQLLTFGALGEGFELANQITIENYLDFFVLFTLALGLSFQLPLMMLALTAAGILAPEDLARWRRVSYFALLIIAAVITPQDPYTCLMVFLPMLLLYEFGLRLSRRKQRRMRLMDDAPGGDAPPDENDARRRPAPGGSAPDGGAPTPAPPSGGKTSGERPAAGSPKPAPASPPEPGVAPGPTPRPPRLTPAVPTATSAPLVTESGAESGAETLAAGTLGEPQRPDLPARGSNRAPDAPAAGGEAREIVAGVDGSHLMENPAFVDRLEELVDARLARMTLTPAMRAEVRALAREAEKAAETAREPEGE